MFGFISLILNFLKNFLLIIIIPFLVVYYFICQIKIFLIKLQYGRKRIKNNREIFEIARLKEDENRALIINRKKKFYRFIADTPTLKKLGYKRDADFPRNNERANCISEEELSNSGYKFKSDIKICETSKLTDFIKELIRKS